MAPSELFGKAGLGCPRCVRELAIMRMQSEFAWAICSFAVIVLQDFGEGLSSNTRGATGSNFSVSLARASWTRVRSAALT